mmetsp:Transcript_1762/g.6590  ORF Transcript_1762/g.6590 Transcript_1762/m.6590 type:complete len:122 (+) Transcript_1762:2839-3204(+)
MGGDEPDRTGSVGRRGGGGGLGPRVRSSGKGGGERSKTNGDRGALEESRGVERKFNSDEAAAMMREEWKRTMDLLRGPEDQRPLVSRRSDKAWTSKGGSSGSADFLSMLDAAMKDSKTDGS